MLNIKLALRTLLKAPFVTAVATLSLALGIGANTAIFSVFDQMLLRPLPVSHPEQLVNLTAPGPNPGSQQCGMAGGCNMVFSYPMFRDLERENTSFTGIAAHLLFSANVAYHTQTLSQQALFVSGSYFPVLGVRPEAGRLFTPNDDQTVGGHPIAVLSYGYWANQLGADRQVVGQTIVVNGQPLTIIGVAARGFEGTTLGAEPAVFIPITMRHVLQPNFNRFTSRTAYWVYLFARLKPGVSVSRRPMRR